MPRYIEFRKDPDKHEGRDSFAIVNKASHARIGDVFFYGPWKKWVMTVEPDTVWSDDCLSDIIQFMLGLAGK